MQVHMHIYCACSLYEAGVKGMESLLVKGMCVCVKSTAHEAAKMSHIVDSKHVACTGVSTCVAKQVQMMPIHAE